MRRRLLLAALPVSVPALAHHGWNSFDQNRPIYLVGTAREVRWANPHVELVLERELAAPLPADWRQRTLPAQSAPVNGPALLAATVLPTRADPRWAVELAPLTRMNAWQVPELKGGERIELMGFTFKDEAGSATLRAEFVWVGGKVYGLRSAPA